MVVGEVGGGSTEIADCIWAFDRREDSARLPLRRHASGGGRQAAAGRRHRGATLRPSGRR